MVHVLKFHLQITDLLFEDHAFRFIFVGKLHKPLIGHLVVGIVFINLFK